MTGKEAAVKKEEPAHIASMEKPAKPPNRLDEQLAVTSAAFVQEPGEPARLKEPEKPGGPAKLKKPGELAKLKEPGELAKPKKPGEPAELKEPRRLAGLQELQGMRRAREGGTAAEADTVRVRNEAGRSAEDAKMDPSNWLVEILTLKENQEGIRIRRSPGDFVPDGLVDLELLLQHLVSRQASYDVDDVSQDVPLASPQVVVVAFVLLDCVSPGLSSFLDVVCEGNGFCSCVVGEALEGKGEKGELSDLLGCREGVELVLFCQPGRPADGIAQFHPDSLSKK